MKGELKPPVLKALALVTHALFIAGAVLLFVYSEESGRPIHLEKTKLNQVIFTYAIGYLAVFIKWLELIKSDNPYTGKADDVPGYLTRELWGAFPYLWTLGKSNKTNQGQAKLIAHTYQDGDVRGKKFREIFVLHANKYVILILVMMSIFLPSMFLNQAPPSFLKFMYSSAVLFTIYKSFFIISWLSAVAIVLLRVLLWAKYRF